MTFKVPFQLKLAWDSKIHPIILDIHINTGMHTDFHCWETNSQFWAVIHVSCFTDWSYNRLNYTQGCLFPMGGRKYRLVERFTWAKTLFIPTLKLVTCIFYLGLLLWQRALQDIHTNLHSLTFWWIM